MAKQLKPKPQKDKSEQTAQPSPYAPPLSVEQLRAEFAKVDANYIDYAKNQQVYSKSRDEMKKRFSGMNNIFLTQMMMTCASPLRNGLSMDSLVSCISMYLGMRLGSKDFRDKTDMAFTKMKYEMYSHAVEKDGPNSKYAAKAEAYKRQMIMDTNGGRYPMTAHSAALTKIAMAQKAYEDMREPDADVNKIMNQYNATMGVLDEQCEDDGVSLSAVNQHMRTYVGQMVREDPQMASVFSELSYDGVSRAPGKSDPDNPNLLVWSGQYQDQNGRVFTSGFSPRVPLTVESAAARRLDMTIEAYKAMREDGADVSKIQKNYDTSIAQLSKICALDGIRERDVNHQMYMSVGEMAEKNPAVMDMFNETTYQGVRRAPYHKNSMGQVEWTGEYINTDGSKFNGTFTPRTVMTKADAANWKVNMAEQTYDDMRNPNANSKRVLDLYNKTDKSFAKWCVADGLDMRDVDRQARMQVGDRCVKQPEYAAKFYELADSSEDAVRPNRPHYDYAADDGSDVWTGEYVNGRGEEFKGFFSPRVPLDRDGLLDHFVTNSNVLFSQMDSHEAFDMAVNGYEAAYAQIFGKPSKAPDKSMESNIVYQYAVMTMQAMTNDSVRFSPMDRVAFPTQVRFAMDNSYAKSFENVVSRQFAKTEDYGELAQNLTIYDTAYDHVFGKGETEISDDVAESPLYKQAVEFMQSMSASGMSQESIDSAVDNTRVVACMSVDRSIYNQFRTECDFVTRYKSVIDAVDVRYAEQDKAEKETARNRRHKSNQNQNRGDIAARRFSDVLDADADRPTNNYQHDG